MALRKLRSMMAVLAVSLATAAAEQEKKGDAPKKLLMPYATAHDQPLEALEKKTDEADDHVRLRVEFNGIKGDRVPAYLYLPKGKKNAPLPAVLLQYGIGGNKNTDYIVAIGRQFAARGFVVLTIDAPGVGERRVKDKKSNAIMDMLFGGDQVPQYCGDYSRAVDFLLTRKEVDKDRIGYVGISWGAITGVTYVAYDPRIKAMGCMVGGGNFLTMFSAKTAEKVKTEGSMATDPVYHVARIAPRPLLFVNVTKDQLILKSWAESLHKYAGEGSKVVWHETDHYFKGVDRTKICESVIDFIEVGLAVKKR